MGLNERVDLVRNPSVLDSNDLENNLNAAHGVTLRLKPGIEQPVLTGEVRFGPKKAIA